MPVSSKTTRVRTAIEKRAGFDMTHLASSRECGVTSACYPGLGRSVDRFADRSLRFSSANPLAGFLAFVGSFAASAFQEMRSLIIDVRQFCETHILITLADLPENTGAVQIRFTVIISEGDCVLGFALVEQVADKE